MKCHVYYLQSLQQRLPLHLHQFISFTALCRFTSQYHTTMQPSWFFNLFQSSHNQRDSMRKHRHPSFSDKQRLLSTIAVVAGATILILLRFRRTFSDPSLFCSSTATSAVTLTKAEAELAAEFDKTASPLVAILHYATSRAVGQKRAFEIRKPFDVLQYLAPCNFLVFGIGHDSLMWDSFNPRGTTLFLEEDLELTHSILRRFPILHAQTVSYRTRLSEADTLLSSYKIDCSDSGGATKKVQLLRGNRRCRLALSELPDEVYDRDWDVIMIDAARTYNAAAPARMEAIYSVAVMARGRKRPGVTHVFLYHVDRKVEKEYAKEFFCMKYRVGGVGKLWHFVIPPADTVSDTTRGFC